MRQRRGRAGAGAEDPERDPQCLLSRSARLRPPLPPSLPTKVGGFEGSSPGRPPCSCLKDRGDIFTPQTAAPLSPPAPIALI